MKVGIMQPYFFPYIGYFELIARTDRWIVFDVVQYNRHSWMNRNRILNPHGGWQYVVVPVVRAPHGTVIAEIKIKDREATLRRTLGQIEHYRKRAPFFEPVRDLVRSAFAMRSTRLVDLNLSALRAVCRYLDIEFHPSLCSTMGVPLGNVEHAGQWALEIAKHVGATEYINPPGGRAIFRQEEWDRTGVRLSFTEMNELRYDCAPYDFIGNLSIIEVLMWNDAQSVANFLRRGSER
jgi:hypothetical protein